jgi:glycoside/pentoside/hexuronide:cation symporter, GPH family
MSTGTGCSPGGAPLSAWRLAAFASPLTPVTVAFVPLVLLLPGFYSQDLGIDVAAVGLALIVARLVDVLTDPLVGFLSDRTRSRLGRRRPWIMAGTPLLMVAVWNLFVPSSEPSFSSVLFGIIAVYVAWTMVFIPLQAWGAELDQDYGQRARINVFLTLFNSFGVLLCLLVPFLLLSPQSAGLKLRLFGWAIDGEVELPARLASILAFDGQGALPYADIMYLLGILVMVLLPVTVIACLLFTRETTVSPRPIDWPRTFRLLQRNKPFARVLAGCFMLQISVQLWVAAQPFYLTYVLGMPQNFLLLIVIMQGFAIVTVPFWGALARRLGRGRSLAVAGLLMMSGFLGLLLAPPLSLALVVVPYLLLGAASDGKWMLPIGLAADAADYDHWKNGSQETALHMAVLFLCNKLGIALGGVMLVALGVFGFQPGVAEQTDAAMAALRYLATLAPMACSLAGVLLMWNFRLTPRAHDAIRRRMERRSPP